jgi:hypothetical protein
MDETKKYHVHDLHQVKDKIGTADTMDTAIDIAADDAKKNQGRCYTVCEGSCEQNKSLWFGDSWDIGQYYDEHSNQQKKEEFTQHNARRLFGPRAEIIPTDEPDVFGVKFKR